MRAENFRLEQYLDRIGFEGALARDIGTVAALMEAQLCSVPFENLDVQAGKGVSLEPEAIVDKIVRRRRGGYCYEVNGLFAMALEALGIPYRMIGARPMTYPARRPRTHMALIVELEGGQWLCDTGFGSYGIRQPMPLGRVGEEQAQGRDRFRLRPLNARELALEALIDGTWASQYSFDDYPHEWVDFIPANHLNSTHPETIFVKAPLLVLFTPGGRRVLFGDRLKLIEGDRTEQHSVAPEEFEAVARDYFGLHV